MSNLAKLKAEIEKEMEILKLNSKKDISTEEKIMMTGNVFAYSKVLKIIKDLENNEEKE